MDSIDDNEDIKGYSGKLDYVSHDSSFQLLFNVSEIGIYRADNKGRIIDANDAMAEILGTGDNGRLQDHSIKGFFVDHSAADKFEAQIRQQRIIANQVFEFRTNDGKYIFVSLSAEAIYEENVEYMGWRGTLVAVTTKEHYRRMLNALPVGTYLIRSVGNQDFLADCNEKFWRMHLFQDVEHAKGTNILDLYRYPAERPDFVQKIIEAQNEGKPIIGQRMAGKAIDGTSIDLDIYGGPLTNADGSIWGRAGLVLDLSEEISLSKDLNVLLHSYKGTLSELRHTISPVLDYLHLNEAEAKRYCGTRIDEEYILELVESLKTSTERALSFMQDSGDKRDILPKVSYDELQLQLSNLKEFTDNIRFSRLKILTLRDVACIILKALDGIKKDAPMPKPLSDLRQTADYVRRMMFHFTLSKAIMNIVDMYLQLKSHGEYINHKIRPEVVMEVCRISYLVDEMISMTGELAESEQVEIDVNDKSDASEANVFKKSVIRALTNLLHNAIRFSRQIGDETKKISIDVDINQGYVEIKIMNIGEAIPEDDITSGRVWEFGVRQGYPEQGNYGGAIGLADAYRVARHNGGGITIESLPVIEGADTKDYKNPFRTVIIFRLPISAGGDHES